MKLRSLRAISRVADRKGAFKTWCDPDADDPKEMCLISRLSLSRSNQSSDRCGSSLIGTGLLEPDSRIVTKASANAVSVSSGVCEAFTLISPPSA